MDQLIIDLHELLDSYNDNAMISIDESMGKRFILDIVDIVNSHAAEADFQNIIQGIALQEAVIGVEELKQTLVELQSSMVTMANMYGEVLRSIEETKEQETEFLQMEKENQKV